MRPEVLTIAGFDPSGGAGILADIKTFENNEVYGFGVCTAITIQNEKRFDEVNWIPFVSIQKQIDILLIEHEIRFVKIGLIKDMNYLEKLIKYLKSVVSDLYIIWDPIFQSSTGFIFHKFVDNSNLTDLCNHIDVITPNIPEILQMFPDLEATEGARKLSKYCKVLLKGGHNKKTPSIDLLFENANNPEMIRSEFIPGSQKHGTGCVLSAVILSNLAKGKSLREACFSAKEYIRGYLNSNSTILGYHSKSYYYEKNNL